MNLLLDLSENTANSFESLLNLPIHIVLTLYNMLVSRMEERREAQRKEEESYQASIPSYSSQMPQMPNFNLPNFNNIGN